MVLWLAIAVLSVSLVGGSQSPAVQTSRGIVHGLGLEGVDQFLGLQFATAQRWKPPVDLSSPYPNRTFQALDRGPSCPQWPGQIYDSNFTAEQCLSLSVWRSTADTGPLPVLVWIYGGGFESGGESSYNGSTLAAQQHAVVVTLNYRIGLLGFLAFEEQAGAPRGNWGLQDQQSALRWVQREIAGFGGDPNRVLIFGQSAGGASVVNQLVMPGSKALFGAAVMESGSASAWSMEFSLNKTVAYGRKLGCAAGPALKSCMNTKTVEQLLQAQGNVGASFINDHTVSPTIDGVVLPDAPLKLIEQGSMHSVPVIAGANTNDASLFVIGFPDFANMSALEYTDHVQASLHTNGQTPPPGALDAVLKLYPASQSSANNTRSLISYMTDFGFACPMRAVSSAASAHVPSYFYRYDFAWPNQTCFDLYFTPDYGVTHTAEIAYVFGAPQFFFGKPKCPQNCSLSPRETRFASALGRLWSSLASGVPSVGGWKWPEFNETAGVGALLRNDGSDQFALESGWRETICKELHQAVTPTL